MRSSVSALLCLALAHKAVGLKSSAAFVTPHYKSSKLTTTTTARELTGSGIELTTAQVLGPIVFFVGGIVGTIMTDMKNDSTETTTPSPAPTPKPAPVVAKAEKVVEEVVEDVVEAIEEAVAVVEEAAPEAAPATEAGDRVAELRRGVAKTLDDEFKAPQTQLLQRSGGAAAAEGSVEAATEEATEQEKKIFNNLFKSKGNKRRTFMRVVKKVVAPWRKWKNIK